MSSAQESAGKSTTKFGLDEIYNLHSPRTAKKESSKSLSFQEPRAVTTRAKSGCKRMNPFEPGEGFSRWRQLHDSLTKGLEDPLVISEVGLHEALMEATKQAKVWGARTVLQARINMAKEISDPSFDRSTCDLASWE
ncbi:hypothetical protein Hanom_Chr11g01007951 [Helianthus anomalus]